MNIKKLKQAESIFLEKYPGGFEHPYIVAMGKKHKMDTMVALAQESLDKACFTNIHVLAANMVKVVSRASMVSMFEKPKFRDYITALPTPELGKLVNGLQNLLYGDKEQGFNAMLEVLKNGKLAKWSLMTIIPNYVYPDAEVFIKPTTAKGVIQYFELQDLEYKPTPTWEFYQNYKKAILAMKAKVSPSLRLSNAAFCGFLMKSLDINPNY